MPLDMIVNQDEILKFHPVRDGQEGIETKFYFELVVLPTTQC